MIEIKKVFKKSGRQRILANINLKIDEPFTVFLGKSGSGKTTLMQIIGALDDDFAGDVIIDGQDLKKMSYKEKAYYRNKQIGFVFQDFQIEMTYTAFENVELPLLLTDLTKEERGLIVNEALKKVDMLRYHYKLCSQMSGGEVQRIAIARAIVNNPKYIFADEPTGNLDTANGNMIIGILQDLVKQGKKVLMVTHNIEHISYADRVITLSDGKVIKDESI